MQLLVLQEHGIPGVLQRFVIEFGMIEFNAGLGDLCSHFYPLVVAHHVY